MSSISPPEFVDLPSGEPLSVSQLSSVTTRSDARMVLLAGQVSAGKTTIITSLHELFLEGPVSGFQWAASSTLPAFERLCHPARPESGRKSAETLRTNPSAGPVFYHLEV